jgi:gliding motility-associated-like protein
MKKLISFAILMAAAFGARSQSEVFNIGNGDTYTGCDAIMHDANGGLVSYAPSSFNQTTICPQAPETQVNLYFIGFDVAVGDVLSIFDGPDDTAPLIGEYDEDDLLFETISPSAANVSGCLTVQFTSNADNNVGDFSMRIICGVPCDFPIADINAEADTIKICPGESVSFDGSDSEWTPGADLANFTWDFGDGTEDIDTWPIVSHTFSEPGGYRVRLYIEDSNECSSENIPEVVVLVSTPYVFDITASETLICLGNSVLLGAETYVDSTEVGFGDESQNGFSTTWIENNSIVFDNGIYIPDNQGCLETEIVFNQFGTAVVESIDDFSSIYFNMEHSFVGDITIAIICPDGSVMSIFPEAGGSGTYLGEPVDLDNGVPGVGYDYSFSPNSTGGSWMDFLAGGGAGTIPAGDYEPEGSFNDLIGCPLNGTWTLEVCDIVGADDGYVFEFGIQFAPEFYPEVLQFTPVVDNGCAGSSWLNPGNFALIGPDCDWAVFQPAVAGDYTLQYQVVNDFGCVYTDEVNVEVKEAPDVFVADVPICNGLSGQLQAEVQNPDGAYAYSWSPSAGLSSSVIDDPVVSSVDEPTTYTVTVTLIGVDDCQGTAQAVVTLVPEIINTDTPQYNCSATFPDTLNSVPQINTNLTYTWWLDDDVITDETTDSLILDGSQLRDGHYQLAVYSAECLVGDTIDFFIAPPLVLGDQILDPCTETLPSLLLIEPQLQDVIISWDYFNFSEYTSGESDSIGFYDQTSYETNIPGYYVINLEQEECTETGTVTIQFRPEYCELIIPNIMSPNGDGRNDTFDVTSIGRFPGSTCHIYNRWGNLIFEDLDYDGAWKAIDIPDGVYYYIVGVNKNTGIEYYSGDLTIVR